MRIDLFRVYWVDDYNHVQHVPLWGHIDDDLKKLIGDDFYGSIRKLRESYYDERPLMRKEVIVFQMVKLPENLTYRSRYTGFTKDKENLTYLWCQEFGVIPELLLIENGLKYEVVDEIDGVDMSVVHVLNFHSIHVWCQGYSFYLYNSGEVNYLTKGINHVEESVSVECDSIVNAVKIISAYCEGVRDENNRWKDLMKYMGEKGALSIPYDDEENEDDD